jgi:hypothetical protein
VGRLLPLIADFRVSAFEIQEYQVKKSDTSSHCAWMHRCREAQGCARAASRQNGEPDYGSIDCPNSEYQFFASQHCESRKIGIWNW